MASHNEQVLQQTKSFYRKFYRFPKYIYVGKKEVGRDAIVELVEGLIGKPYQWYKRRKVLSQLDDALRLMQQA